jgi:phosphoribosylformylglycinamidine synthase
MTVEHFFRSPGLPETWCDTLAKTVSNRVSPHVRAIRTEFCFNVLTTRNLSDNETTILRWLLSETFEPELFGRHSFLQPDQGQVFEVGPRLSFSTAWSTNAVSVCHACGLQSIPRIERSRRFQLISSVPLSADQQQAFLTLVHDRMTERPYVSPLVSFEHGARPEPVQTVPVLERGRSALEELNDSMGLAFDDWDLDFYTRLFRDKIGRNPTTVECFDVAQSNSEHSRHWFFGGRLVIDGIEQPRHLMAMVREPLKANPNNSVIAFRDNSSSIQGHRVPTLIPSKPGRPGPMIPSNLDLDLTLTAETHNFPSGVAPFPGAETGTGGRIRDGHATGRASLIVAGSAGYCVGNLQIPGAPMPWENDAFLYPETLASPLDIEIQASNGASDYGNKFGEPVVTGFTRSFGLRLPDGSRREWIKPIMFSGGVGQMDAAHAEKGRPRPEMLVVKIGGPAYRIGMGGGAASSMVQGENTADLDFNAVQRGDAEMEQKVNRVIRACSELGERNPIVSIHDQGAGGNCNVLKEIVEPEGAVIEIRDVLVADQTLSVLEIWGAEYQENDALLLKEQDRDIFGQLCAREKAPWAIVGRVTGDGRIVVHDAVDGTTPVDLVLEDVLGDMPRKVFNLERQSLETKALELPDGLDIPTALSRVLRLLSVGSKRFLTTKVDRAVTGLVARQQCAGPLQLTVSDVAVIAHSHFATTGGATAIGEQPIKALIDPSAMARMSVGEALTNLVWAQVSTLPDVRCSANWMWAAKLPGEGAALHDALVAMKDCLIELGMAVDGGKDSLSMAAMAPTPSGDRETVKAPGTLVISAYAPCPDITRTVTPDLELPGRGRILLIDLGEGRNRLGGSALAQVYSQVGDSAPDIDDVALLGRAFDITQRLIEAGTLTAGHDRSDGGLATTLLEMAFAGNCGLEVELPPACGTDALTALFAEELGLVMEVDEDDVAATLGLFRKAAVPCTVIGRTIREPRIRISVNHSVVLDDDMRTLRDTWEATSFSLERLQADPAHVEQEERGLKDRRQPTLNLSFTPQPTAPSLLEASSKPKVAVLREEGSNSDREMASAFHMAGFECWDVTMSDLLEGRARLDGFRGLAAVGGFSYADVLDSAKGWAGSIRFNEDLRRQFDTFYERPDTFSLGVCNGCQLLALLGWVPWRGLADVEQPRFVNNASGRFESRFATVTIEAGPSIMLKGMEGSTLGIWLQHGEGRALFPRISVLDRIRSEGLAPVRYVNDDGRPTETYPFNPNGSPEGIAALCSPDGRHLAIMPHPERTFLPWQWAWMPRKWRSFEVSPWLRLFQNARNWCS